MQPECFLARFTPRRAYFAASLGASERLKDLLKDKRRLIVVGLNLHRAHQMLRGPLEVALGDAELGISIMRQSCWDRARAPARKRSRLGWAIADHQGHGAGRMGFRQIGSIVRALPAVTRISSTEIATRVQGIEPRIAIRHAGICTGITRIQFDRPGEHAPAQRQRRTLSP